MPTTTCAPDRPLPGKFRLKRSEKQSQIAVIQWFGRRVKPERCHAARLDRFSIAPNLSQLNFVRDFVRGGA
jgi:hypothetical protein